MLCAAFLQQLVICVVWRYLMRGYKASGNEELNTAVKTCPVLSSLSASLIANLAVNLSAREAHLFKMLQSVTLLPGPPSRIADSNVSSLSSFLKNTP